MTVRVSWDWHPLFQPGLPNSVTKSLRIKLIDNLCWSLERWQEQWGNPKVMLERRARTMPTMAFYTDSAYTHWLMTYQEDRDLETVFSRRVHYVKG